MAAATQHNRLEVFRAVLVTILTIPLAALSDTGSKLEKFEKDATLPRVTVEPPDTPPPTTTHPPATSTTLEERNRTAEKDKDKDDFEAMLILAIPAAIAAAGMYSWYRVSPAPADDKTDRTDRMNATPRLLGEGVVPFVRLDASYQRIGSRIHATDNRAEIGYGPFGFEFRELRYTETDPDAVLEFSQYHALYRMSAGDHVELDVGYGRLDLTGTADSSGGSWTLPILIHPSPRFGIEYRPSWAKINGTAIRDQELALSIGSRFWTVRGGYHWLESPDERLSGPFIGLSLRL